MDIARLNRSAVFATLLVAAVLAPVLATTERSSAALAAGPPPSPPPPQCDLSSDQLGSFCDELLGTDDCFPIGPCNMPEGLEIHDPELFDALFGTATLESVYGPNLALVADADGTIVAIQTTFDGTCWRLTVVGRWIPWIAVHAYGDPPIEVVLEDRVVTVDYLYAEGVLDTGPDGTAMHIAGAIARSTLTDLVTGETASADTFKPLWVPRTRSVVSPDRRHPTTGDDIWIHPSQQDCEEYCIVRRFMRHNDSHGVVAPPHFYPDGAHRCVLRLIELGYVDRLATCESNFERCAALAVERYRRRNSECKKEGFMVAETATQVQTALAGGGIAVSCIQILGLIPPAWPFLAKAGAVAGAAALGAAGAGVGYDLLDKYKCFRRSSDMFNGDVDLCDTHRQRCYAGVWEEMARDLIAGCGFIAAEPRDNPEGHVE